MKLKKAGKWYALIKGEYAEQNGGYFFTYGGIDLILHKDFGYKSEWSITHLETGMGLGLKAMGSTREKALSALKEWFPQEDDFAGYINKAVDMKKFVERYGVNPMYAHDKTA